jgi:SNF2 family DNA or RNA helicase
MDQKEKRIYDQLKRDLVVEIRGQEIDAVNAASLSGKLIQMANGACYSDGAAIPIHDRKLDALEDLIEGANGKPLLVAYWFKHDLKRIQERFPAAREIRTSKDITEWNAGKIPLAVIHPASAGHGLNLQAGGSTLVWFGLTWSLELYQQTNARLWRQGQTSSTVVIHHIMTKGTIDVQIMQALERKDKTQSALIDAVKAQLGGAR